MRMFRKLLLTAVALLSLAIFNTAMAEKIKVAGIYTQPLQQKWDARLHLALQTAADAGEILDVLGQKAARV